MLFYDNFGETPTFHPPPLHPPPPVPNLVRAAFEATPGTFIQQFRAIVSKAGALRPIPRPPTDALANQSRCRQRALNRLACKVNRRRVRLRLLLAQVISSPCLTGTQTAKRSNPALPTLSFPRPNGIRWGWRDLRRLWVPGRWGTRKRRDAAGTGGVRGRHLLASLAPWSIGQEEEEEEEGSDRDRPRCASPWIMLSSAPS